MNAWAVYPAFLGTFISIAGWTMFVHHTYDHTKQFTLSDFGAQTPRTVHLFRIVVWVCGPLFATTMFFYIVPAVQNPLLTASLVLTIVAEMSLGFIMPTGGKKTRIHESLANAMGVGMLSSCLLFAVLIPHFRPFQIACFAIMASLSTFAIYRYTRDKRGFVFLELAFFFLAHFSVLAAVLALVSAR